MNEEESNKTYKMQGSIASLLVPKMTSSLTAKHHHHHQQCIIIKRSTSISMMKAAAAGGSSEVDYNSMQYSVFRAEACETLGGVACDVEMFPETKLKQSNNNKKPLTRQTVDREYLQYDSPKTVFIAEACDDLGGEFCEAAYQSGDI